MSEIRMIDSFDALLSSVNEQCKIIAEAKKTRLEEYKRTGRRIPHRIKFEELDLGAYKTQMLRVHKTLQGRLFNNVLGSHRQKARIVAIAGICELIKDEYVGKFWDLYEKYMGMRATYTVYDWIWEEGFRQEGIELIFSRSGFRREFVQTLVLESGIPKQRYNELIDFFILYWRYFRHTVDVEELITEISDNKVETHFMPPADREKLINISKDALEFSRAFSLVVEKLSKIFEFIESSEEMPSRNLSECIEYIRNGCGIDPMEIIRDKDQLKKLYDRINGLITPEKLIRILRLKLPGDKIKIPKGTFLRADQYAHIMYGEHILKDVIFSCVPTTGYTLADLHKLPFDKIISSENDILLKSRSVINVVVNQRERPDLVRELYVPKQYGGSLFLGYLFYYAMQPATTIELATENGAVSESVKELDGFYFPIHLEYIHGRREKTPHIAAFIPQFRFKSENLAGENIAVISESIEDPLFELNLDENGLGIRSEETHIIESPRAGTLRFLAVKSDSLDPILIMGKEVCNTVKLFPEMLFSSSSKKLLYSIARGSSVRMGGKRFVLFREKSLSNESLKINNLKVTDKSECGNYRVFFLEWDDTSIPCSIVSNLSYWAYEKCLELNLYSRKKDEPTVKGLTLSKKQSFSPGDFELVLYPVPPEDVQDELYWHIVINNRTPYRRNFRRARKTRANSKDLVFSGKFLEELIEPAWNSKTGGSAVIEIYICNSEMALDSVKFWLFPELTIHSPKTLRPGDGVQIEVKIEAISEKQIVVLKDKRGSSKAKLRFFYEEGKWKKIKREYSGILKLEQMGTTLEFSIFPDICGVRLGSPNSKETELPRDILRKELNDLDIIISGFEGLPFISINDKKVDTKFSESENSFWIPLGQLSRAVRNRENIVTIESYKELIEKFKILFNLTVDNIEILECFLDNCIEGSCSFAGPEGSRLRFLINEVGKNNSQKEITKFDIDSDGIVHTNSPFSIPLDPAIVKNNPTVIVKCILIQDATKQNSYTKYGEAWKVTKKKHDIKRDYDYLKSNAVSFSKEGRYFAAKRLLEAAAKIAPRSEKTWIKEFMMNINCNIVQIQIKSISTQTAKVLKDDYKLDDLY